jgi:hypothetical protein
MTDDQKKEMDKENSDSPLVFISHDNRDAELAEAFSKLLKSVSAGMLKSFRSSDKKGTEGIQFGDDWYKRLMSQLDSASDVVCLLTERSLDRPWILYEAGVAKGKLETPVHGIALGIALSRVATGPFYQFQNSDDNEESLTKLVLQLCERIPALEPDKDVVKTQVQVFKRTVEEVVKGIDSPRKKAEDTSADEGAVAKVLEEMKLMVRELPMRIEQNIVEGKEYRPKRTRRFHPMMIDEMTHMISQKTDDPIGILIIASIVREDFPWLYEIGVEAYRTAKAGDHDETMEALKQFQNAAEITMRGPFMDEFGTGSKETHMMMREFPMAIDHYIQRLDNSNRKRPLRRRRVKKEDESN